MDSSLTLLGNNHEVFLRQVEYSDPVASISHDSVIRLAAKCFTSPFHLLIIWLPTDGHRFFASVPTATLDRDAHKLPGATVLRQQVNSGVIYTGAFKPISGEPIKNQNLGKSARYMGMASALGDVHESKMLILCFLYLNNIT
jgi:hypothetical protein